ncbi:MAG TPA: YncE family protein, partial [Pirellula sp.]|nr:YncE family protein [Pirellula sp.]
MNVSKRPVQLPGLQSNGQTLLPNGWSLRPAGDQIDLGDFPSRMELSPDGKFAAILHTGWGTHEIRMFSIAEKKGTSSVVVDQTFQGIRFNDDGSKLFVSGAEDECIYVYGHHAGYLTLESKVQVVDPKRKFVVSSLAGLESGNRLLVCGMMANQLAILDLGASTKLASIEFAAGSFPFEVVVAPDKKRAVVSLWGKSSVAVIDLKSMRLAEQWLVRSHPTEMLFIDDGKYLLVGCADDNSVVLLETDKGTSKEIIQTSLFATKRNGSTPNSLSISPDENVLLVANADNNNIAMF